MFTRQHYKVIAKIIKGLKDLADVFAGKQYATNRLTDVATGLADYFAKDNPRFDRDKFLKACGL